MMTVTSTVVDFSVAAIIFLFSFSFQTRTLSSSPHHNTTGGVCGFIQTFSRTKKIPTLPHSRHPKHRLFGILEDVMKEQQQFDDNSDDDNESSPSLPCCRPNQKDLGRLLKYNGDDEVDDATTIVVDLSTYIEIVGELKENMMLLERILFSSRDGSEDVIRQEIRNNPDLYCKRGFQNYLRQLSNESNDRNEQEGYENLIVWIQEAS